jgi:ParB family chromosome partitioning protein
LCNHLPQEGSSLCIEVGNCGGEPAIHNAPIRSYPWVTLAELKGDPQLLKKLDEAEKLLKDLKTALSK